MNWSMARRRTECGAATVFVLGMSLILLACAGLVWDGGHAINERMTLADAAEQGARAGADQIDEVVLREQNIVTLDPGTAEAAAIGYLTDLGYTNISVDVGGDQVEVTITDTVSTNLLGLIGFSQFDIEASATADAQQG